MPAARLPVDAPGASPIIGFMPLLFRLSLAALVALLTLLSGQAQPATDTPLKLDPVVVKGIRPLTKVAEHPMLEPRFGAAVVAEGDYLYIIGGSNDDGTRLDSIERVDLRTGHAEKWAKLQIARRHHRAIILGGKIYVLGGTSGPRSALTAELADYLGDDPPIDESMPPNLLALPPNPMIPPNLPASRIDGTPGVAAQEGAGGLAFKYESTMEIVDLATGRSTFGPAMPVAKALFGCVELGGKIWVIGGQKLRHADIVCTSTTEVFDPAKGQWSKGVYLPTPRRGTAAVVDGFVIFLGGYGSMKAGRTIEVFNPQENIWRRLPPLSESVNPSATVWAGNYLFLFGDQERRSHQLVYDLRRKELVTYPLALPETDFAAAVFHGGKIYVVGGASLRLHETTETVQIFAPTPETLAITSVPGKAGK